MRHNVVARRDITGNFLKEKVRFNHPGLILQLLLRHVRCSVEEGDVRQDCKQTELLPNIHLQTTNDLHRPFILFLCISSCALLSF